MLKLEIQRGQTSGHKVYDYVALVGSPREIAELVASLGSQLAAHVAGGADRGRAEPRFTGTVAEGGEVKAHLGGYLSIFIEADRQCAHPSCRETFDALAGKPAAAFRKAGLVCEAHKDEAK